MTPSCRAAATGLIGAALLVVGCKSIFPGGAAKEPEPLPVTRAPEEVVVAVFETERDRLTKGAKVKRFVDVLAEKHVRSALRRLKP